MSSSKQYLAVAAIDFGTTYSGWALSFRHEYERDPLKVETRHWHNGENITLKTSSSVLIQPDGKTLEGFGYKAEDRYQEIVDDDPKYHKGYFYFSRFKMVLFREDKLTRKTELIAQNGTRLPAIVVFQLAIKSLKDDALAECSKRFDKGLTVDEIHWTLTVPAIWDAKAKQFMREAGVKAGIPDADLTIVLEPEAASIYCKNQPVQRDTKGVGSFKSGTKYIVLDCGGGTIDISCHEIIGNGQIREIHRVKGNDLGGMCVDKAFAKLLEDVFGYEVWGRFKNERKSNYTSFFRQFETKKRELSPFKDVFNITIPYDLYELYTEENGIEFKSGLAESPFADNIMCKPGTKLQIKADYVSRILFEKSVAGIVNCVKGILKTTGLEDMKHLLLVGGYGESKILQERIREEFPELTIIVPQEPGLAVLIGAVIFGHDTSVVRERVSPFTFGTNIAIKYDNAIHTEDKIVLYDGQRCVSSFKLLAKCNQSIENDNEIDMGDYVPRTEDQKVISFPIYAVDMNREVDAENKEGDEYIPVYSSDPRCTELGKITAEVTNMDVPRKDRKFKLNISFGKTEIEGMVTNIITKKTVKAKIDFIA